MSATKALLADVRNNLSRVLSEHRQLKTDGSKLEQHIADLQRRLGEADEIIMKLEDQNRQLRLAKAVSGNGENTGEAKVKINELVREIDKCLAMLNV